MDTISALLLILFAFSDCIHIISSYSCCDGPPDFRLVGPPPIPRGVEFHFSCPVTVSDAFQWTEASTVPSRSLIDTLASTQTTVRQRQITNSTWAIVRPSQSLTEVRTLEVETEQTTIFSDGSFGSDAVSSDLLASEPKVEHTTIWSAASDVHNTVLLDVKTSDVKDATSDISTLGDADDDSRAVIHNILVIIIVLLSAAIIVIIGVFGKKIYYRYRIGTFCIMTENVTTSVVPESNGSRLRKPSWTSQVGNTVMTSMFPLEDWHAVLVSNGQQVRCK